MSRAIGFCVTALLCADVLHRAWHAPWVCDESCLWPWGRWPFAQRKAQSVIT